MSKGKMRIYGCGGAGINITKNYVGVTAGLIADIKPCFIDTSTTNLTSVTNDESTFILEDVDGSGKLRRENHQEIQSSIKNIINTFPPQGFNIVVFSASGGSGSVLGPLLMAELIGRGETTVGVVIGTHESSISADNTLNTLKSLESLSTMKDSPFVVFYEHMRESRNKSDEQVKMCISALAVLANGDNRELDSMDISNWINYDKVTDVEPQLALLDVLIDTTECKHIDDPISVLSILNSPESTTFDKGMDYGAVGYLPESEEKRNFDNIHFVISTTTVSDVVSVLKDVKKKHSERAKKRGSRQKIINSHDNQDDSGLVL